MGDSSSVSRKDKLLYLLDLSSDSHRIVGRKKLMKLAFFLEHYDPNSDQLVSEPQVGEYDFEIFKYGPFSKEVLDDLDDLKRQDSLRENSSRMQYLIDVTPDGNHKTNQLERELSPSEKEQMEKIAEKFSSQTGSELESLSLELLGISKREKDQYRGMSISSIVDGASPIE